MARRPPMHRPPTLQQPQQRLTTTQKGYDYRWKKYRAIFLQLNPLCRECEKEGRFVPATVVDHIIPHRGDKVRFWDESNHQGLCKSHHDTKTASEDGGFGNS